MLSLGRVGLLLPFGCSASTASGFPPNSAVLTAGLESWYSRNMDTTVWTSRLSLLTLSRILWNADCPSPSRHPIMVCRTQVPRKRWVRNPMLLGLGKQALNSTIPAIMTFLWHLMLLSFLQNNSLTSWHGGILVRTCLSEVKWSRSVVSDSLQSHGLLPTRFLYPRDFPGKNIGVGCHFLLQRIFPTQGSNPGLRHCRQMLYRLSHQRSPKSSAFLATLPLPSSTALLSNP